MDMQTRSGLLAGVSPRGAEIVQNTKMASAVQSRPAGERVAG